MPDFVREDSRLLSTSTHLKRQENETARMRVAAGLFVVSVEP